MPSPKKLLFHEEARERICSGVDALAEAVSVTLGPRGRTVILEDALGAPQIVNSGVVVARSIELEDRFENMGARLLCEVATRTSEMAGDGTTTATVLAREMIIQGKRYIAGGMNPMELKHGMELATAAVVRALQSMAKPCTSPQDIAHVASIAANNDRSIGDLLASAMEKVGREGAIAIEDGSGLLSVLEVVDGLQFDRGYLSPFFVNNTDGHLAVLEDCSILLCDGRLSRITDLLPLLEAALKEARPLLVIAEDLDSDVLSLLVVNAIRSSLKTCAVKAPGFGEQRKALLQDLAALTGAHVVSEEMGLTLAKTTYADLGHARRVEVGKDSTTIIGGTGQTDAIQERVAFIRKERETVGTHYDRERLDERAAKLSGGVALIKVGAATETELKERKLRVEDALHATRAAVDEGIVPGGGVALLRARNVLSTMSGYTLDESSGIRLVMRALEGPLRRIVFNAGEEASVIVDRVEASSEPAFGYNAVTRSYGNLLQMGVIDPAKVTRLALQNAASIAGLVLTTDCLIVKSALANNAHQNLDTDSGSAL